MLGRLVKLALAVVVVVFLIQGIPDARRYLKIRQM